MSAPALQQLHAAWLQRPPAALSAEAIAEMLIRRFHAYEIPVSTIPASDYEMDEDVTPDDVWKLFTIDDPQVLAQIVDDDQRDFLSELQRDTTMGGQWAYILGNFEGDLESVDQVGFRLITVQTGRGERISVVLESRAGVVSGFKVYGPSVVLIHVLIAHVGFAYPASNPHGVAVGDIDDEDFAQYLRHAFDEGLLKLSSAE